MKALTALMLILALALLGCGSSEDGDGAATIAYETGGGMTGQGYRIEIEPGGAATLQTYEGTEERLVEFEVPGEELADLNAQLQEADVAALGEELSGDCFDCFSYSLEYGGESAAADSATMDDEFLAATEPLRKLADDNLPPGFGP